MPSTLTANKLFQEPAAGDTGWNTPLNFNFSTMDQALGSSFPISTTGGTTPLTTSTTAVSGVNWWSAQQIVVSGTLTSNATITIVTNLGSGVFGGSWIVRNNTNGSFTLTFKTVSGNGVTIAQGSSSYVYSNGTDVLYADSNISSALTNPTFDTVSVTSSETIGLPAPQTVTISIASPGQISASTVPALNTKVVFTTTGALPTGLTAGTTYYVVSPTATTFSVAATINGTAINTSGTQSGVHTATFSSQFNNALNITNNSKFAMNLPNIAETATVTATSATGTINYDVLPQSVLYYTAAATGNWTLNVRGNSFTTLNSVMGVGQSVTIAFLAQNQTLASGTVTMTISTPSVITVTGTLPANGTPVSFTTTGALPTGLSVGTTYYVVNASGSTYNVASTIGGSAIATSGTQSGVHTATYAGLFNNLFQIDGSTVVPKWQGGGAPSTGFNASIDVYAYTIIKTAATPSYTVLASVTKFA